MATSKKTYTPINCAFHDYLEHFATLRQIVTIVFINEDTSERETIEKAIIVDLSGGRNGEFTHIKYAEGEKVIRNDYLISVGDIKMSEVDSGNCGV